jgi:sugar transferase (PEP-CTERM system associated)
LVHLFRSPLSFVLLLVTLGDALLLGFAGQLGTALRDIMLGHAFAPLVDRATPLAIFVGTHLLALFIARAYAPEVLRSPGVGVARVLSASSIAAIGLAFVYMAFPKAALPGMGSLFALPIGFVGLVLGRRAWARLGRAGLFHPRVLVLGGGDRADRAVMVARSSPSLVFLGQIDLAAGVAPDALAREVHRLGAGEVVLAPEERRRGLPLAALLRLRTSGIQILDLSTFIERETGRIDLAITNPSWLIFSTGFSAERQVSAFIKRLCDVVCALVLLALLWPVMAVAALAVKLDSPGGVLFRQQRIGLYGASFELLKLRSMKLLPDAPPAWTALNDPRLTRVGKWIRRVRIDELPQLWNVLRGEMSLVGPRPEQPCFVTLLESQIPYYAERHMIKPGITGWAQVNYPYGANVSDARAKLEYDLYYAKNYSFFLDVEIILKTLRVILVPQGVR